MCPRDKLYVLGYFHYFPVIMRKNYNYELSPKLKFERIPLYILENIYEDTLEFLKNFLKNQENIYHYILLNLFY